MENEVIASEDFAAELSQLETAEQPTEDSAQAEAETGEEVEQQVAEEDGEDPESEGEEQSEEDSKKYLTWKTKAGETFKVESIRDLQDGYMRNQHFTQGLQVQAEKERQFFEKAQRDDQIKIAMFQDAAHVTALHQRLNQLTQMDLSGVDPQYGLQVVNERQRLTQEIDQAKRGFEHKRSHLEAQFEQGRGQRKNEAIKYAMDKIPNMDLKGLAKLNDDCLKAGYTDGELSTIDSGRLYEDLWKARQWDALQSQKGKVQNKVKTLPPVSGKAQRPNLSTSKQQVIQRAVQSKGPMSKDSFASLLNMVDR